MPLHFLPMGQPCIGLALRLVSLKVESHEINALADSGTVTSGYVHQHEFPVLPLEDLMDHPLNLVGLGGTRTQPLGFMILQVQVTKIMGYDVDIIFLVVPAVPEFSRHVPLRIGTCMLGRIVNVIKESDLDRLCTSWAMAKASHLLSRWGTVVVNSGAAGDGPLEEGVAAHESS